MTLMAQASSLDRCNPSTATGGNAVTILLHLPECPTPRSPPTIATRSHPAEVSSILRGAGRVESGVKYGVPGGGEVAISLPC